MKKNHGIARLPHLIGTFALLSLLVACKKDEDTPAPEQQNNQLIRSWKVNRVLVNDQPYPGNEFDNWQFEFRKDSTYKLTNGTGTEQGHWELSTGNKLVLDKGAANEITFAVLKLDQSALDLETRQNSPKTGEAKIVFKLTPL